MMNYCYNRLHILPGVNILRGISDVYHISYSHSFYLMIIASSLASSQKAVSKQFSNLITNKLQTTNYKLQTTFGLLELLSAAKNVERVLMIFRYHLSKNSESGWHV